MNSVIQNILYNGNPMFDEKRYVLCGKVFPKLRQQITEVNMSSNAPLNISYYYIIMIIIMITPLSLSPSLSPSLSLSLSLSLP